MIDIIVTAHNDEHDIWQCIKSIQEQSCKDYTLTVVLDKSTDRTLQILHSMGIEPIITDFGCAGGPRNIGLESTSSEYVWFVDGDDHLLHTEVVRMITDLLKHTKANGTDLDMLVFGFIWKKFGYVDCTSNGGNWFPNVWSKVWRREAIGDIRFGDDKVGEDLKFFERMIQKELTFINWDVPMIYYNNPREGSLTWQYGTDSEEI